MPIYDKENKYHKTIMSLARKATKNGSTEKLLRELEESYLGLCKTTK